MYLFAGDNKVLSAMVLSCRVVQYEGVGRLYNVHVCKYPWIL